MATDLCIDGISEQECEEPHWKAFKPPSAFPVRGPAASPLVRVEGI